LKEREIMIIARARL